MCVFSVHGQRYRTVSPPHSRHDGSGEHWKDTALRGAGGIAQQVVGRDGTAEPDQGVQEVQYGPDGDDSSAQLFLPEPGVTEMRELDHEGEAQRDEHVAPAESGEELHGKGSVMTAVTPRGALASRRRAARSP